MRDAASELYQSLSTWGDLQTLIDGGETEGLHLECKSPSSPNLDRGLKSQLARALSGYSNTAGGVILWGVATTPHSHSKIDVISQLEPLGNCAKFEKQLCVANPSLTSPSVLTSETKLIKHQAADT